MINDLPDDKDTAEEDAPLKVAYHKAPISEEPEESANQQISKSAKSEEPETEEEEKDPLDDEEAAEDDSEDEEPEEEESENSTEPETPSSDPNLYYIKTVKAGEQPEWPRPKDELNVFGQPIDSGLMQYFAYPRDLKKTADDLPNAEVVAGKNKSDSPVIIIDQVKDHLTPGCCLELILANNGHALAKTDSNLDNLEANITSLIDSAKTDFGITAEHFISTGNVSSEVEKRLNDLEDAGGGDTSGTQENPDTAVAPEPETATPVDNTSTPLPVDDRPVVTPKKSSSKRKIFIIIFVLAVIVGLIIFFRGSLMPSDSSKQTAEITPTPTTAPTPTPTIGVDRSKYTVRVLNGTPKSGAAGILADILKAKGWLIDKTGNATSSAVAESYVRGKINIDEVIKTLIADVSDHPATASSVILPSSDKADLEFVIGKK